MTYFRAKLAEAMKRRDNGIRRKHISLKLAPGIAGVAWRQRKYRRSSVADRINRKRAKTSGESWTKISVRLEWRKCRISLVAFWRAAKWLNAALRPEMKRNGEMKISRRSTGVENESSRRELGLEEERGG